MKWLKYRHTSFSSIGDWKYEEFEGTNPSYRIEVLEDEHGWMTGYYGIEYTIVDTLPAPVAILLADEEKNKIALHLDLVKKTEEIIKNHNEKIDHLLTFAKDFPTSIDVGKEPNDFVFDSNQTDSNKFVYGYYLDTTWKMVGDKWQIVREQNDFDQYQKDKIICGN